MSPGSGRWAQAVLAAVGLHVAVIVWLIRAPRTPAAPQPSSIAPKRFVVVDVVGLATASRPLKAESPAPKASGQRRRAPVLIAPAEPAPSPVIAETPSAFVPNGVAPDAEPSDDSLPATPESAGPGVREAVDVMELSPAMTPPVCTQAPALMMPDEARRARVFGEMRVRCQVLLDGVPRSCRVTKSLPYLDGAALEAVRQWRCRPAMLQGRPVPVEFELPIRVTR